MLHRQGRAFSNLVGSTLLVFGATVSACSARNGGESVSRSSSAWSTPPTAETVQFSVQIPIGSLPTDVLASATANLTIEEGVRLDDSSGGTTVSNTGPGTTNVGVGTIVGDKVMSPPDAQLCQGIRRPTGQPPTIVNVISMAPVVLQQKADITGGVLTASTPTVSQGALIEGAVTIDPGPFFQSYA
jgi:hypothetical protein